MSKLTVKVLGKLGDQPHVLKDRGLIIIEKDGVPVCVALDGGADLGGGFYVGTVRDPDFTEMLFGLGIDKTVLVQEGKDLLLPTKALLPANQFRGL